MTCFVKTARGQEELTTRSGRLGARARRLLILADGQRTLDELTRLSGDENAAATLQELEDGGFLEHVAAAPPAGGAVPTPNAVQALVGAPGGAKDLQMARDFMMNTLRTFNGPYAKLDLVKRIHASRREEELRELFDEWLQAITETTMGRKRADELSERLLKVM
ncbi:MAG TPA: hypothetical protein PKV00_02590 [Thauera sp.]|nr:hypothetical protein [Thauera sp.]